MAGAAAELRAHGAAVAHVRVGFTTSGAVLSTVTDAADRDYRLYLLSDCVAAPDRRTHDALMTAVLPRLAHLIDAAELCALLHRPR
ncbi:isochorismatase family protein [Nonomuraea gerenzanensis]|uniref:Isochorismatase hydrolase n=1 Tax=Nonomuraea gerenzanensis TaxID=93944 RepID=A0A1M4EDX2_9ACTN|nr:isochorismatase family protein [Nonomuraea gerenzanensis]UBU08650.1 cysteine hydrolase [Nonomuraea gerenzanensis]SBO97010.1 isochorismatase hydrolase [Nonomuraea gerenzanensis]